MTVYLDIRTRNITREILTCEELQPCCHDKNNNNNNNKPSRQKEHAITKILSRSRFKFLTDLLSCGPIKTDIIRFQLNLKDFKVD